MDKYSDTLKEMPSAPQFEEFSNLINQHLENSLRKLVKMSDNTLGFVCSVPTGAGSNSVLRAKEPIIIALEIHLETGAIQDISVYPDRTDFPFTAFPHINPANYVGLRTLCILREKFVDWYAENTLGDFIYLIRQWFEDAVKGNLVKVKEGDRWEPLYLGESSEFYFRTPIFDTTLQSYEEPYHQLFQIERCKLDDKIVIPIGPIDYNYDPDNGDLGLLLYRGSSSPLLTWIHDVPTSVIELLNFIESYQNWEKNCFRNFLEANRSAYNTVYLQLGFARPTIVLGKTTCIDYVCFKVNIDDLLGNDDGRVELVQIYDLPTPQFARQLSSTSDNIGKMKFAIIGCGAIGSKLAFHLFRCGFEQLTLIDDDVMLSHNYLRHALTKYTPLINKACLVRKSLLAMLPQYRAIIKSLDENALQILSSNELKDEIVIDCSASAAMLYAADEYAGTPAIRFAISNLGKIGLLYFKGNEDVHFQDYYMYLLRLCVNDHDLEEDLSHWLNEEAKYTLDKVRIGEGCHSTTMIIGDDLISTHTGIASNLIRHYDFSKKENLLYLSFLDYDWPGSCHTYKLSIPNFKEYQTACDWSIRIPADLEQEIQIFAKAHVNKEAGGYLLGSVDRKRKIIYVLHTFIPQKSKSSRSRLMLSHQGWKEELHRVINLTANSMMYLGDWHSHPKGSTEMSAIDIDTCCKTLRQEIDENFFICMITDHKKFQFHIVRQ